MPELATYALFAYRQEAFVAAALRGVARQTYRPLEVIVVDDGSPDRTRAVIEDELRSFPADIQVTRIFHESNQGLPAAINAAVRAATGRVIIFGAGDDISAPERVAANMEAFGRPGVTFVHSAVTMIDADGRLLAAPAASSSDAVCGLGEVLAGSAQPIVGASCAYAAEVFRRFEALPPGILREDVILPLRALLLGQGRYLSARLVQYRTHAGNLHSLDRPQSSAELVARNLMFAEDRRSFAAQLEKDLGWVVPPEGRPGAALRAYLRRAKAYAAVEQTLLRRRWKPVRLGIILRAWLSRSVSTLAALKLAALFVVPWAYAPLLRLRIRWKTSRRGP
ncbi:MAG: hypothetical protein RLZZ405_152 [Verrucomicrobiota bacterium]|jgi:hypothetical protein